MREIIRRDKICAGAYYCFKGALTVESYIRLMGEHSLILVTGMIGGQSPFFNSLSPMNYFCHTMQAIQ